MIEKLAAPQNSENSTGIWLRELNENYKQAKPQREKSASTRSIACDWPWSSLDRRRQTEALLDGVMILKKAFDEIYCAVSMRLDFQMQPTKSAEPDCPSGQNCKIANRVWLLSLSAQLRGLRKLVPTSCVPSFEEIRDCGWMVKFKITKKIITTVAAVVQRRCGTCICKFLISGPVPATTKRYQNVRLSQSWFVSRKYLVSGHYPKNDSELWSKV